MSSILWYECDVMERSIRLDDDLGTYLPPKALAVHGDFPLLPRSSFSYHVRTKARSGVLSKVGKAAFTAPTTAVALFSSKSLPPCHLPSSSLPPNLFLNLQSPEVLQLSASVCPRSYSSLFIPITSLTYRVLSLEKHLSQTFPSTSRRPTISTQHC
jgi:hypothetical protein